MKAALALVIIDKVEVFEFPNGWRSALISTIIVIIDITDDIRANTWELTPVVVIFWFLSFAIQIGV